MPEKTPRVLVSPALSFSKKARKTINLPRRQLAQASEFRGGHRAGTDAAPAGPVTIAAAGHGQAQPFRPSAQLENARTAHVGIFDLDRPQTLVSEFGEVFLFAIIRRVRPRRNAARGADKSERLGHG